jgi:anti-anti-sigma regulatory factor
VILDIGANERLDITSVEMLAQLLATLRSAGIDLVIADARQPVIQMAARSGLLDQLGQARIFHTIDEAVQNTQREEHHPTVPPSH